jgi:hypothetical protein
MSGFEGEARIGGRADTLDWPNPTFRVGGDSMSRRLIAAVACVGALSFALVGGATAGASTARNAKPSTAAPASITVSPSANLKRGSVVTVSGSGWVPKHNIVIVECNADGSGPGPTAGSCDTTALKVATVSSSGTFSTTFTIVVGAMASGKTLNECPQTAAQAVHAVYCIIGAADLSTKPETFALQPIHFSAPPLSITFAKASPINGHPTYSMKITDTGDYAAGYAGFEVIGAAGADHSRECQGSSNGKSTWTPPGLPVCTVIFGEVVQINLNGRKVMLLRVGGSSSPGDFSWTLPHTPPGIHYTIEALGLESGEELTTTATVP